MTMNKEPPADPQGQRGPLELTLFVRLRTYFLAGVLITAPSAITLYIAWLFIDFVDSRVTPWIPRHYNPENYLPFTIPGLGLLIVVVAITFIGALTTGFVGRLFVRISEGVLARMPVIRGLYGAVKQIFETVLAHKSSAFRQVVLFEYPRRGTWAMGFLTGVTQGEVQAVTDDTVFNVFLPTTPNPTSGYLLFVPKRELIYLEMSVEEGIKMIVSGGIVTPPNRRPPGAPLRPPGLPEAEPAAEPDRTPGIPAAAAAEGPSQPERA